MPSTPPDAADRLFALDAADFTVQRDRLASDLRAAGRRDAATAVKALRRPTVAAAVLNRLSRTQPDQLDEALQVGAALAREQRRALSGVRGADVKAAVRRHHDVIDRVIGMVQPPPSGAVQADIRQTLLTAAVDPTLAALVRRGVLQRAAVPADATTALALGTPLMAVPTPADSDDVPPKASPLDDTATPPDDEATARLDAARAVARDAQNRREDARRLEQELASRAVATRRRARARAEELDTSTAVVTGAAARVDRLRHELTEAEDQLEAVRAARSEAERSAEAAGAADATTHQALEAARAALARAEQEIQVAEDALAAAEQAAADRATQ